MKVFLPLVGERETADRPIWEYRSAALALRSAARHFGFVTIITADEAPPIPSESSPGLPFVPLSASGRLCWSLLAIVSFHLAYGFAWGTPIILLFLFSLFRLAHTAARKQATDCGVVIGLLIYGPQLQFFWTIFNAGAIALWCVLACWLAFYLMLQRLALVKLGHFWGALAAPLLWVGVEYFRSELYYLRFSWLGVGSLFPQSISWLGIYGLAGVGMLIVALFALFQGTRDRRFLWGAVLVGIGCLGMTVYPRSVRAVTTLPIAGVQLEFAPSSAILKGLDIVRAQSPGVELFVLSEYSFDGPVPEKVKEWCRKNHCYLVAGGKNYPTTDQTKFYNTAFVIGPEGTEVFQQAKCVPIQLFADGFPAPAQKLWDSPWGKLGFCVCYDLSYTRVVDELVRQGAQAIIVPTMDVEHWGLSEHRLHARIAPARASEYGVPIFRLCSSGISQSVDASGVVRAEAPFPGPGEILAGRLELSASGGRLPIDRVLVWPCLGFTGLVFAWACYLRFAGLIQRFRRNSRE